ncbi:MAG: hypothetical protein ACYCUD_10235, partial [Candidatus Dormibacteria bacterium]
IANFPFGARCFLASGTNASVAMGRIVAPSRPLPSAAPASSLPAVMDPGAQRAEDLGHIPPQVVDWGGVDRQQSAWLRSQCGAGLHGPTANREPVPNAL